MKTKNEKDTKVIFGWICIVVFFVAMMFVFGVSDDHIAKTIYSNDIQDKSLTFSTVVSAIGAVMLVLPIFFAVQGLLQMLLITKRVIHKNVLYWSLNALLIVICMIVNFWTMIYDHNDINWNSWIVQIVFGVFYLTIMVLYDLWFWNSKRKNEVFIKNNFWLGLRAVIYLVTIFVVVNVMKPIFGRPRPSDVYSEHPIHVYHYPFSISPFTNPRPASFPSGHTITAMSIFALTLMFYRKPSWKHYTINTALGLLVALVAIARIVSLHHWASDTFMSIGIGALAYSLYLKLFNKRLIK